MAKRNRRNTKMGNSTHHHICILAWERDVLIPDLKYGEVIQLTDEELTAAEATLLYNLKIITIAKNERTK